MSKNETTRRSTTWLAAIMAALALFASLTAPAGAQVEELPEEAEVLEEQRELTQRESELNARVDAIESQRSALDAEEVELDGRENQLHAQIETAADRLELLALERRQPAIIRGNIAIERFVSGDPAREAFELELQAIGGTDPSQDPLQQQEVLSSIIENVDGELDRITEETANVRESVAAFRSDQVAIGDRRGEVLAEEMTLVDEIAAIESQLEDVATQLASVAQLLVRIAEREAFLEDLGNRGVLTGRPAEGSPTRPALAVKIDNVPNARPQSGINSADVVYVELVEGGSTRFAAVFQSENVGTIGPIRSMRTTDLNLLRPLNNPLFASSGANRGVTAAVNSSSLVNISASTGAGRAYFRDNGRFAPHNLYSTDSALRATSSSAGSPPPLFTIRPPGTPNPNVTEPATGVNVSYQNTSVSYVWDGNGWARSQDGGATIDASTGARTAPETVIVRFTPYGTSQADRNSPEATTVGTGAAWIFTEGQLIRGNWSKDNGHAVTVYTDSAGNVVELQPGRVWVELPLPGTASLR